MKYKIIIEIIDKIIHTGFFRIWDKEYPKNARYPIIIALDKAMVGMKKLESISDRPYTILISDEGVNGKHVNKNNTL